MPINGNVSKSQLGFGNELELNLVSPKEGNSNIKVSAYKSVTIFSASKGLLNDGEHLATKRLGILKLTVVKKHQCF